MNKKLGSIILSVIFTLLLLVILFMNISIQEIAAALGRVPVKFVLLAFIFHLCAYICRVLALSTFLENHIALSDLLWVHFLHNFYVHMVPASLGEFSFPMLLKKKIPLERSLSVLLVFRFVSMALTLGLFFISLFFLFDVFPSVNLELRKILFLLLVVVLGYLIYYSTKRLYRLVEKVRFLKKILTGFQHTMKKAKGEFARFNSTKFVFKNITWTFLSISSVALFYLVILKGMAIHLNVFQVIFVSSIGIAFLILPVKSIGGFGTTEGTWTIGLLLLGFSKEVSIQAGFVVHIFSLLNVLFLFLVGLLLRHFQRRRQNLPTPCKRVEIR